MSTSVKATAASVHELATALKLDKGAYRRALELADLQPGPNDWRRWLDYLLAATGAFLLLAGVTAFFAWNWADLGRMVKFALIEVGMVGAMLLAWRLKLDTNAGRAALFAGAFFVGVLLAVVGQAYQTGADPYSLFLVWAVLILPLVLVGRQAALWLLFVALLDVALILYWTQVLDPPSGWWARTEMGPAGLLGRVLDDARLSLWLFALNATALAVWEFFAKRDIAWLAGRVAPRLLAFASVLLVLVPTFGAVFGLITGANREYLLLSLLLFACTVGSFIVYYQFGKRDLFMLTIAVFAAIVVVMTLASVRLGEEFVAALLFLAVLLIALFSAAVWWLRQLARRWGELA